LKDIDEQKRRLATTPRSSFPGGPRTTCPHGARGTGKSSLVKAALNEFATRACADRGGQARPGRPADIVDIVADRRERFVIFCDDLSFEASDGGYKSLQVALDGSIAGSARTSSSTPRPTAGI